MRLVHLYSTLALMSAYTTLQAQCPGEQLYHSYSYPSQLAEYSITDAGTVSDPSNWSVTGTGHLKQSANIYGSGDMLPELHGTVAWLDGECWSDFVLRVQVFPDDNDDWGLLFRANPSGNGFDSGYQLHLGRDAFPGQHLHSLADTTWTELHADPVPAFALDAWQELEIAALGTGIEVRLDGNLVMSVIDEEHAEGSIGLWCRGMAPIYWDNLLIAPPGAAGTDPYADLVIDSAIQSGNQGNSAPDPDQVIGAPDNLFVSLGGECSGNDGPAWVILDMGADDEVIRDGPEGDFEILEIGNSDGGVDESYAVRVSNSPDGPWDSLGVGIGNAIFDLASIDRCDARYVRIDDLSSSTCSSDTPGSDIDGIVAFYPGPAALPDMPLPDMDLVDEELLLHWSPVGCADSFFVDHSPEPWPAAGDWIFLGATADTSWSVGGVPPAGSMGFYRVRAWGP